MKTPEAFNDKKQLWDIRFTLLPRMSELEAKRHYREVLMEEDKWLGNRLKKKN